jgi:L-lactate dehydrogenase
MIADKISKNEFFDFNCLLTSGGVPTNDPKEVFEKNGTVMPVGGLEYGHKGFGLALGIEALSQGLSGSGRSKKTKINEFINICSSY